MKNYVVEVQNEINNLKSLMTDEEFFGSPLFFRFLENYIRGVVFGYKRCKNVVVHNICNKSSDLTACTDGNVVHNNTFDAIIQKLSSRSDRYYGNCGKVCHEIWHILYTDFAEYHKHCDSYQAKSFQWYQPLKHANAAYVEDKLNKNTNLRNLVFNIMTNVSNIYEDAYINIRGSHAMPGIPSLGISIYYEKMISEYGSLNQILENDVLSSLMSVMHLESMGIKLIQDAPLSDEENDKYLYIRSILDEAKNYTDQLIYESNGKLRQKLVDEVIVCMFPLIEQLVQDADGEGGENTKSQNNDGSSESSNDTSSSENGDDDNQDCNSNSNSSSSKTNDVTKKIVKKIVEAIEKNLNTTELPNESSSPIDEGYSKSEADEEMERQKESRENRDSDNSDSSFNSIENEILENIANSVVEKQHSKDVSDEAIDIRNEIATEVNKQVEMERENPKISSNSQPARKLKSEVSKFYYNIQRITDISDNMICNYDYELSYVKSYGDTLVRELKKILKDKNRSNYSGGYRMGRLDCKSVARSEFYQDGKIFRRRFDKNISEIAFSLLIDESGSMRGKKISIARRTAILLEYVLAELDIPYMVTGHKELQHNDVTIDLYRDFEQIDNNDKYRLTSIQAEGCNVDGMAIAYNSEKLLQRKEDRKVLIVISDGIPASNALNFEGDMELAKDMVANYRRKGVEIFGAVIDGEYERISEIYGDRTMDCTDLNSITSEITGLVKRYIMR